MAQLTQVRKYEYDAVDVATASGNAARIAAAQALKLFRRDRTISNRTIGLFDFRSPYCTKDGEAIAVGKAFRNLVNGGSDASVANASGVSYHTSSGGVKDGIRFAGDGGRVLLPAAFKLPASSNDFLFTVWLRLHAALTGSNYRSFAGWGDQAGLNAYSMQARTTSILGLVDSSAVRTLVTTPALETVYQLAIRYRRDATNVVTEPLYRNGTSIGTGTGFTDSAGTLNQPGVNAYLGSLVNYYNAGMDFTIHRVQIEDLSLTNDRPNPDALEIGSVAVATEWTAYQARFN